MFTPTARFYDAVYSFKDYAAEAAEVRRLIEERCPNARTLLDVACGTGKHLEYLRDAFRVEGLDLDAALLEIARARLPDIPLHQADMTGFDLGRRFDAVTCLFSSIGYVRTVENLNRAVAAMARHVETGGVLFVEGWLSPSAWVDGHVGGLFVDEPELKLARVNLAELAEGISILDMQYLVATPGRVERFEERHELGLFEPEEYIDALQGAGLDAESLPDALMGRGVYVGVRA